MKENVYDRAVNPYTILYVGKYGGGMRMFPATFNPTILSGWPWRISANEIIARPLSIASLKSEVGGKHNKQTKKKNYLLSSYTYRLPCLGSFDPRDGTKTLKRKVTMKYQEKEK